MTKKIVMLAGKGFSTNVVYNALSKEINIDTLIVEENPNAVQFFKRRIKKLGFVTVFGQLVFQIVAVKMLRSFSKKRIEEIKKNYNLKDIVINNDKIINVISVNSDECLELLKTLNPDIIVVNGTRIISKKILNSINAVFINTHAGITPKYRGVHGGYWALINNDLDNCGVTVHLVDSGIDTGKVIYQATINPTKKDNFTTYFYLQLGEGIQILIQAIKDAKNGILQPKESLTKDSFLWYHPTIWFYIYNRIKLGVR